MGRMTYRGKRSLSDRLLARQRTPTNPVIHSLNWFPTGLGDWINRSEFDVVNLHWLGAEMLSVEEIGLIRKPVCWTMHDMWPFSGAEHYDDIQYPGRYRHEYTRHNRPPRYSGPDLDAWVWRRKRRAWAERSFHLVSPSCWLAGCAAESALMARQPCCVIPNCVDTDIFKPIDRRLARGILNLDPDRRYVLFGATASTSDLRKGFHLLQPALCSLARQPGIGANTELLVFGAPTPERQPDLGLPVHYLGTFHDDMSLAVLYSAADVFAAPSMQDNLPNTLVESLACGTPCVAFSVGGMPDLVEPGITGYLAEPGNPESFMRQLLAALQQRPLGREAARNKALRTYSSILTANRYKHLYESAFQLMP
jgi:glycosyltransferase involved in cell wall biosynthesis